MPLHIEGGEVVFERSVGPLGHRKCCCLADVNPGIGCFPIEAERVLQSVPLVNRGDESEEVICICTLPDRIQSLWDCDSFDEWGGLDVGKKGLEGKVEKKGRKRVTLTKTAGLGEWVRDESVDVERDVGRKEE